MSSPFTQTPTVSIRAVAASAASPTTSPAPATPSGPSQAPPKSYAYTYTPSPPAAPDNPAEAPAPVSATPGHAVVDRAVGERAPPPPSSGGDPPTLPVHHSEPPPTSSPGNKGRPAGSASHNTPKGLPRSGSRPTSATLGRQASGSSGAEPATLAVGHRPRSSTGGRGEVVVRVVGGQHMG